MRVLYIKDQPGGGKRGDVKEVTDGYAKNFLIAKGFAVPATQEVIKKVENENRQKEQKKKKDLEHSQKLKSELDKRTFTIIVKTGDKGQVFGSVHEKDVIQRIKDKMGVEFEKSQLILPKHMKELGEYTFDIKLGNNITAHPKLKLSNG